MKELFSALVKAQRDFKAPIRDTKAYNYRYAQLDQVIDCVKVPLLDNGLFFYQSPIFECEKLGVKTVLFHVSGQSIEDKTFSRHSAKDIQQEGSQITYLRRYALLSILGLAPEDNDASDMVKKDSPIRQGLLTEENSTLINEHANDSYVFKFGEFKGLDLYRDFTGDIDKKRLMEWISWFHDQPIKKDKWFEKNTENKNKLIKMVNDYLFN